MKVGFIGLGQMGAGMAAVLIEVGHELTIYNGTRSKEKFSPRNGSHAAVELADACRGDAVRVPLPLTNLLRDRNLLAYGGESSTGRQWARCLPRTPDSV